MLAHITTTWLITLPTIITGFVLLRKLKQIREEAAARAVVAAPIARKK